MRLRNPLLPAGIVAAGLVWLACSHKVYTEPGPPDGSSGDDAQSDTSLVGEDVVEDTFQCNPCLAVCPCTSGDTFYNPGKCETVTCLTGTWGGESCIGLGCEESGPDETGSGMDGGDGSIHPGDAAVDGSDGASDAPSDGAGDGGD